MRIAVLSGKGGTGKTFVSVNLACAAEQAVYVDCDVEEPNGHLFLKPKVTQKQSVTVTVPEADMSKCNGCRKCVDFCKYNALALLKDQLIIFDEVCHSCGGCILFCPEKALLRKEREIGTIEVGVSENVDVLSGRLNTGEVSGVPVIRGLMEKLPEQNLTVIDCPPGSACTVMESIQKADFCILVAEPTLFGAHNLAMVYQLVKFFSKPCGAVLNKCLSDKNPSKTFCRENNINILAEIPYDVRLGRMNSLGLVAARENEAYRTLFRSLLHKVKKEVRQ
ncbi:MAG: ATP-binding protein [Oscillospiraceae bacterium]|jgi:MinD superfamily P-loop ATPase